MTVAVAISSGFRTEIRAGLASITGDVSLMPVSQSIVGEQTAIERHPSFLPKVFELEGVESVKAVVYKAGIVRVNDKIHGVMFKGVEDYASSDSLNSLSVSIPTKLSKLLGLAPGDDMPVYFVGEKTKVRKFRVDRVYESILEENDKLVVLCSLADLQRVNGWSEEDVSAIEITLDRKHKGNGEMEAVASEIGFIANSYVRDDETTVYAASAAQQYPQLFDWLNLIDFNVLVILVLMTIVAGFNMISGLLILLFENISTIGVLKSLGMTDRAIAKTFLMSSSVLVLKGMVAGNLAAFLFCALEHFTHVIKLSPENYFLSYVPVQLDIPMVLAADLLGFVVVMLLLLIPCRFISKVDPAQTVRVE